MRSRPPTWLCSRTTTSRADDRIRRARGVAAPVSPGDPAAPRRVRQGPAGRKTELMIIQAQTRRIRTNPLPRSSGGLAGEPETAHSHRPRTSLRLHCFRAPTTRSAVSISSRRAIKVWMAAPGTALARHASASSRWKEVGRWQRAGGVACEGGLPILDGRWKGGRETGWQGGRAAGLAGTMGGRALAGARARGRLRRLAPAACGRAPQVHPAGRARRSAPRVRGAGAESAPSPQYAFLSSSRVRGAGAESARGRGAGISSCGAGRGRGSPGSSGPSPG